MQAVLPKPEKGCQSARTQHWQHAAFSSQMAEKRKYHGTELRIHLMLEPQNHQLEPAKHH